jgi:hypothetical protein
MQQIEPVKAELRSDRLLHSPVILLRDVVEILDLVQSGEAPEPAVPFQIDHWPGTGEALADWDGPQVDRVRPGQGLQQQLYFEITLGDPDIQVLVTVQRLTSDVN